MKRILVLVLLIVVVASTWGQENKLDVGTFTIISSNEENLKRIVILIYKFPFDTSKFVEICNTEMGKIKTLGPVTFVVFDDIKFPKMQLEPYTDLNSIDEKRKEHIRAVLKYNALDNIGLGEIYSPNMAKGHVFNFVTLY